MKLLMTCPHCKTQISTTRPITSGQDVQCPKCKGQFSAADGDVRPAPAAQVPGAPRPVPPATMKMPPSRDNDTPPSRKRGEGEEKQRSGTRDQNDKNQGDTTGGKRQRSSVKWYYQVMGETFGPYSIEKLRLHAEDGRLTPECQVREGEDGCWVSAYGISGLFPDGTDSTSGQTDLLESIEETGRGLEFPLLDDVVLCRMPKCCLFCGNAEAKSREYHLKYCPWWMYALLGYWFAEFFFEKRARMWIPACDKHKGRPNLSSILTLCQTIIFGSTILVIMLATALILPRSKDKGEDLLVFAIVFLFSFLICLSLEFLKKRYGLNCIVTDRAVVVTRVSPVFLEAVRNMQPADKS